MVYEQLKENTIPEFQWVFESKQVNPLIKKNMEILEGLGATFVGVSDPTPLEPKCADYHVFYAPLLEGYHWYSAHYVYANSDWTLWGFPIAGNIAPKPVLGMLHASVPYVWVAFSSEVGFNIQHYPEHPKKTRFFGQRTSGYIAYVNLVEGEYPTVRLGYGPNTKPEQKAVAHMVIPEAEIQDRHWNDDPEVQNQYLRWLIASERKGTKGRPEFMNLQFLSYGYDRTFSGDFFKKAIGNGLIDKSYAGVHRPYYVYEGSGSFAFGTAIIEFEGKKDKIYSTIKWPNATYQISCWY